jgi:predicted branched-subunit amino acid permease
VSTGTTPTAPAAGRARTAALLIDGARSITPLALGVVPFGLALGAAIRSADVDPLAAWSGSFLILAGSAHLTVVELLDRGAAPFVVVVTALLVNARILVYGAGLAPWFRTASTRQRMVLAVPITDPLYLAAITRFERRDLTGDERLVVYAGAALHLAGAWVLAQTIGVLAGQALPAGLGLHLASPLALAGMLASATTSRRAGVAAAVAALVAVTGAGLPHRSAAVAAIAVGVAVASYRRAP